MKLKEIPLSIYFSLKLLSLSKKTLLLKKKEVVPVIVSLTSIPSRIPTLHLTIRSILNQSVTPEKIILWLHNSLEPNIPNKLKKLQSEKFEIRYSNLTCSHRKLVHSLEKYPNKIIITCDDDMMYRNNWLFFLYNEHICNPNTIIGNQTRYIRYTKDKELLPYKNWIYQKGTHFNQKAVIPIGSEGVLYPPGTLHKKTTKSTLYLKLTPKADDLWFKAMAIINGTDSLQAKQKAKTPIPIIGSQKYSLKKSNIGDDKNRIQWLNVTEYLDIDTNMFL